MNIRPRNCLTASLSILEYLAQHGWKPEHDYGRDEVAGLCPLHRETRPSFYVNRRKQVFYCHACGRGGGLPQLRRWLEGVRLSGARRSPDSSGLLDSAYAFYRQLLPPSTEALVYLRQRGIVDPSVIERMRIGYAPGACLRAHLAGLGYRWPDMLAAGLIDARSRDRFFRCLTFPLEEAASLYGRSIDHGMWRHRFLSCPKGGLYGWQQIQAFSSLILVEGLFDLAALWQAGFPQAVSALGCHPNPRQLAQLSQVISRKVYLCFDADVNGSGQVAAKQLSTQLRQTGVETLRVELPAGFDPASFFAAGGSAQSFQRLLERSRP
jgi:DNA primase